MTTQGDVSALGWQRGSRRQALHALARAAGFGARPVRADTSGGGGEAGGDGESDDGESISALVDAAGAMGLDVEAVDLSPSGLLPALRNAAPLLLGLPRQRAFLAVLRVGVRTTTLVVEGGRRVRVPTAALTDALWAPLEAETNPGAPSSRTILADAGLASIPAGRRRAAARVLRTPGLVGRPLTEGWIVRPVLTTLGDSLRGARVRRRFAGIVAAYLAQFLLFLALWKQVGARAFDGGGEGAGAGIAAVRFLALLGGWVLIQLAASAAVSRLALDVGAAVRSGLMRGAMRLDRDRMRAAGMGQLLGRAIDAEVLDTLALGGGVEAMAGLFQIAFGAAVLGWGATPGWSLAMLAAVLAAVGVTARGHARRLSSWCDTRRALTHDLVERMIGHRTALVQDRPTARAAADETSLGAYEGETRALDRAEAWLGVGLPRAWLIAGLVPLALAPAGVAPAALALSVGGIWLAYGALRRLGDALPTLSQAREAWGRITPLVGSSEAYDDGTTTRPPPPPRPPPVAPRSTGVPPVIEVDRVAYRYPGRSAPVFEDVSLTIAPGERLLIEGPSGGGKSTLAALLTGLKAPSGGTLRLHDQDQRSLGLARWRRAVAGAPQFHDNHVMGADLLFNLLMGRRWPPRAEDLAAAERVCHELGLRPLLDRMPAGLFQLVGETGWQLSHGERSRLFVARSLLQELDARVLDESFASLDPQTLEAVLAAVLARPEVLIVIAHP